MDYINNDNATMDDRLSNGTVRGKQLKAAAYFQSRGNFQHLFMERKRFVRIFEREVGRVDKKNEKS